MGIGMGGFLFTIPQISRYGSSILTSKDAGSGMPDILVWKNVFFYLGLKHAQKEHKVRALPRLLPLSLSICLFLVSPYRICFSHSLLGSRRPRHGNCAGSAT